MVYLKAIEANGFKSFADKVDIKFDSGVTAVVGPNGSGKSNITDAIRWVLGEQSARTIRGVKMEDVIFNGTDSRKSMNAATVKLKLDNTSRILAIDEDDVTIARKLYRNGDSEYYINSEQAKLKEITELFLDSGLGRNAYNIISQGEVDSLLKARPDERRTLIEEAAGVMKYKLRKKESGKRLTETKENLNRVNDIISELEGRVKSLEIDSANAKEYLALKEEMSKADIEVTVHDTTQLLSLLETEQKKLEDTKAEMKKQQETSDELEAALRQMSAERDEVDLSSRDINKKIVDASKKLEQLNGKIELFEERKSNKGELQKDLAERLAEQRGRHDDLEEQIGGLSRTLCEYDQKRDTLKASLKETAQRKEQLTKDQSEEIEQLKDDYYQLMVEKTTLENDRKRAESVRNEASEQYAQQQERLNNLKSSIDTDEQTLNELDEELTEVESRLDEVRSRYKKEADSQHSLNIQYDNLKEKFETAARYVEQQKSKLDMLKNMQNEYRGYFPGVRRILKKREELSGVIGSVGELISVTGKYVTALDTALGAASQNIIMATDADAKSAINFLKKENSGFATFLPKNVIKPRTLYPDLKNVIDGSDIDARILGEIVEAPQGLDDVVSHLLGTTIVVDSIDDAAALSREAGQRLRIVTLDGGTIMPGGAMSGGSKNNKNSIIEAKQDIAETKEKLASYEARTKELRKDVTKTGEEITETGLSLSKLEDSGTALKETFDELKNKSASLEYRIDSKKESLKVIEADIGDNNLMEQPGEFDDKIKEKAEELRALDDKIQRFSRSDKEKKEALEVLTEEENATERELLSVEERRNHQKSEYERLSEALREVKDSITQTAEEQEMVELDLNTLDIKTLASEKEEWRSYLDGLYGRADEISEKQHDIKRQYQQKNKQREEISEKLDTLQDTRLSSSGRKEKLDTQLEQKFSYLSEQYKLTFERARQEYTELSDIEEKRIQITLNKKSIEELGAVNLGSIEEFERVDERYQFLKEQEEDLLEARSTLLSVISDMDDEVSTRFKEAFHQVNHHFSDVFKEMFGGGEAELRLTEEEDYLEAGVEIYAQPPGKKLSSLSLLSGGERALTAISLLFSILKVRVSPFIILDEVEAALDEANVVRYSQYLKKLSKDTQFIVITHRKGTMEESDRLFGVTMAERGVSQLISVDLKNYHESVE